MKIHPPSADRVVVVDLQRDGPAGDQPAVILSRLRELLRITKLNRVLETFDSETAAVDSTTRDRMKA